MSFKTFIQNLRTDRKIEQEKTNAAPAPAMHRPARGLFVIPVALAFVMLLTGLGTPVAAVDINLTIISDVINAFIDLIEPITNLIIAIVPLWFIMQILGFIMGLLAAVLAMIKFGKKSGF